MKFKYSFIVFFISISVIKPASFFETNTAKLQLLNKRTGSFIVTNVNINSVYKFDDKLFVLVRSCLQSSKQDDPENIAFLQVAKLHFSSNKNYVVPSLNNKIAIPKELTNAMPANLPHYFIFSGFMYSSSPSANALEDSIYDITLLGCM